MPRGRPKHPDILTPREWQVLELIREGLTNDQIARRLGISENGAKYHVLEILSKLGVSSRYEAAAWRRETAPISRRFAGLAALFVLRPPKLSAVTASKAAMATLAATVFGFMAALAIGVAVMNQRASGAGMTPEPTTQASAATTTATSTSAVPPTSTPAPTPILETTFPIGPQELTGMPASGDEMLSAFAASQGLEYAGTCSSDTNRGQLCLAAVDGVGDAHRSILAQVVVYGPQVGYQVVLDPIGPNRYEIARVTGPYPETGIPPSLMRNPDAGNQGMRWSNR
jgi:DNA-binding CsgD family transcriptional regulator